MREEAALDGAGGLEVGLQALPLDGALVEAGVFDGGGGLDGEGLEKVDLVEGEDAVGWGEDDELGEGDAGFVVEGEAEEGFVGGGCGFDGEGLRG